MKRTRVGTMALFFGSATLLLAQSNVDDSVPNKHGWGENVGWTNWHDANAGTQGVEVGYFVMSGYIWGENVGFINVGDGTPTAAPFYGNANGTDFGVNIDSDGELHGYAWGENVGWINFDGGVLAIPPQAARIVCGDAANSVAARLTGFAWGENIGWINLEELSASKFVSLTLAATPITCDVNQDGTPNSLDVQPFVNILLLGGGSWTAICSGDVENVSDSAIDYDDVTPFVDCLLQQP